MESARQALAFVRRHGVVLEAARGPVPSLADAIAGEELRGGWWSHPSGKTIFALTRAVRDDDAVLVARLVDGKITFVHRRLWPALVRLSSCFPERALARVVEEHTPSGRHVARSVPFASWATDALRARAAKLSERAARTALGAWVPVSGRRAAGPSRRPRRSGTDARKA